MLPLPPLQERVEFKKSVELVLTCRRLRGSRIGSPVPDTVQHVRFTFVGLGVPEMGGVAGCEPVPGRATRLV